MLTRYGLGKKRAVSLSALAAVRQRAPVVWGHVRPCKRRGNADFLGYTFRPRRVKNRWGKFFVSFLPAMSTKAAKTVCKRIREWRMASTRNNHELKDLARVVNPAVRGWMNYYGRFYRSRCVHVLRLRGLSARRAARGWGVGAG